MIALKKVAISLGTPAAKPTGKFPIKSAAQVTKLAGAVENLGASAYLGQAGNIQSKEILAAALAIHTVEARHAATLNTLLKKSPTPDGAFAKPMSMARCWQSSSRSSPEPDLKRNREEQPNEHILKPPPPSWAPWRSTA